MKRVNICSIALVFLIIGCETKKGESEEEPHVNRHEKEEQRESSEIVQALRKKDRGSVYVALWTLKNNHMCCSGADSISYDAPYAEAQPVLQSIAGELEKFSSERLAEFDMSLKYHWSIYSPIWVDTEWD